MIQDLYIHDKYIDHQFDQDLIYTKGLTWLPWVGIDYVTQKEKLLVLGESHYDWGQQGSNLQLKDKKFTRYIVSDHGLSHIKGTENNRRLFRNIERTFFNEKNVSNAKRVEFWSRIGFLNMVQVPMADKKKRPSFEDYMRGWVVIKSLITILNPTIIIVLGTENNKIKSFQQTISKEVNWIEKVGRCWRKSCTNNEFNIDFEFIKHPSSFYSWTKWNSAINYLLPLKLIT